MSQDTFLFKATLAVNIAFGSPWATCALDSQSERLVQQAIEQFERQHTVLVIAHRMSTIVNADQILALGGVYAGLWWQQAGGAEDLVQG